MVFQTKYNYFKYEVIFFGLSNTLASLEGYINKILDKNLVVFIIIYLDDILIYNNKINHIDFIV